MKKTRINPTKEYSLGEIVRLGLIPGVDSISKASRLIKNRRAKDVLQAEQLNLGLSGIGYAVRGSNIISYIKSNGKK